MWLEGDELVYLLETHHQGIEPKECSNIEKHWPCQLLLGNCFWREGFEAAFRPKDNNSPQVAPIVEGGTIQSKKSPSILYRTSASSSPGRVGSFRWRGGRGNPGLAEPMGVKGG
jgi:hypothetical protein